MTAAVPVEHRAGFGSRLVAVVLDSIVLGIAGIVLGFVVDPEARNGLGIVLGAAYYTWFEGTRGGQTPGKQMLGIRVVDRVTGHPPDAMKAFLRYVCSIVSAIPCLLGYFWMLWDGERDTWHDKLSGTAVVRAVRAPDLDLTDDGLWAGDA